MFEVFLTNRAEKVIKSFDNTKLSRRIEEVIVTLSHTYFPKGYDIKKLKGVKGKVTIANANTQPFFKKTLLQRTNYFIRSTARDFYTVIP